MAPHKSRKIESEDESASDKSSLGSPMKEAHSILDRYNKEREAKRKAIEGRHEARVKEIRTRIDELHGMSRGKIIKSQKTLWARLDALNKRRQILEGRILNSMQIIELNTKNISSELAVIFEGRLGEMNETTKQKA